MPVYLSERLRTATESRFEEDWARQRRTATDILRRLQSQEGVILADQVGMGKTYVALAVAVSEILSTPELRQVVIFVPPAVADKWIREWRKFSESLLEPDTGIRCVPEPVRSGEEFLKLLDDAPERRNHIIVVTHTALTATLKDTFVQLALLHYATRNLREGKELRQRISKWSTGRSGLIRDHRLTREHVSKLLDTPPSRWRETWKRLTSEDLADDPVPAALESAVRNLQLERLREVIRGLPIRSSADIDKRLEIARKGLSEATQATWKSMLSSTDLEIPLLIVDEAHRLKNPLTQVSKLFGERSGNSGAGAFKGIFDRMLFLTATPFELGHAELIEVLRRMGAVRPLEPPPTESLEQRLANLRTVLTAAQTNALILNATWGRLTVDDLPLFDTWGKDAPVPTGARAAVREAWEHSKLAVLARHSMHGALKPWVIRHERPYRRDYHPGAAIALEDEHGVGGLRIPEDAALPFLLGARVQSVALDEKRGRPLYAYGIASSYEAFRRLDSGQKDAVRDSDLNDDDRDGSSDGSLVTVNGVARDSVVWYRREIDQAIAYAEERDAHPKVRATVEKALQLWIQGEKCLVFCWFIKTGEVFERVLAKRVDRYILDIASTNLGTSNDDDTRAELDRLSDRIFRRDSSSYERIRQRLEEALAEASGHRMDVINLVTDAAIRHLRTPSYLVRYTPLCVEMTDAEVWAGINGNNARGTVLLDRWRQFAKRLANVRSRSEVVSPEDETDSEFARISSALLGAELENDQTRRGASLHPVRRAHGGTERAVRERLIALFNTPLAPDLLVASSVMGEGIDLHQECRFVIHHDLDWNPSILEQRTGRLDRIGAYAEREGKSIEVYEPYLAGTHDEKMFRVVKDRAQWFDIVMGRQTSADEKVTDVEENRLPLHSTIREAMTLNLCSPDLNV